MVEAQIAQIDEAIRPMLEGADVESYDLALVAPLGAKVSSKSVLQLEGETRKATRRADNFVKQLLGPRSCHREAPRIYISPGNNMPINSRTSSTG